MEELHGILHGLAYVILGIAMLVVARLFRGLVSPYPLRDQLTEHDNPAAGLALVGYFIGVIIIYLGAAIGPEYVEMADGEVLEATWGEIGMSMLVVSAYTLGGIVCLNIGSLVVDKLVLRRFCVVKELVEDRNAGTGAVIFGSAIATSLIIAGAIHGEGGGPLSALAFFVLGQVVLVAFAMFYQAITSYDIHEQIEKDNVAAGVAFGLSIIAIGVVLLRAVKGDLLEWTDNLAEFAYFTVAGFVVLAILRFVTDRVFLPGTTLHAEIERDRNLNAAWIEGVVAIGAAVIVFFMM